MRGTVERVARFLRRGPRHVAKRAFHAVFPLRARCFPEVAASLDGRGLEVGGPSPVFGRRGILPVYPLIESLDNCNFAAQTVWEGRLEAGRTFRYGDRTGFQLIGEAWQIRVADESYGFVLSSHMLEHSANPLRVLGEWLRVMKPRGHLLLILPHGPSTMEHRRPITTLEHLREDYRKNVGEDDLTHVAEAVELHDMSWTPEYRNHDQLRELVKDNWRTRLMHHHVFNEASARELVRHAGFRVLASELVYPFHIVVFAAKPA